MSFGLRCRAATHSDRQTHNTPAAQWLERAGSRSGSGRAEHFLLSVFLLLLLLLLLHTDLFVRH